MPALKAIFANEVFTGGDAGAIADGVVAFAEGVILFVGARETFLESPISRVEYEAINAKNKLVTPGLIDPHTHLVFGGERSDEYAMRAAGKGYLEIAAAGGGILSTVRATRAASLEMLTEQARPRLDRLLSYGVTTAEVKSGYGLDLDTELRLLKAIKTLNEEHPIDLVATFLGAHTFPMEYRDNRDAYCSLIIEEMIPAVAEQGLAEFCDVFVEEGAFTLTEAEKILSAGLSHGLQPKLHADQLSAGGGAELAARMGAVSADHLEFISEEGVHALSKASTVAVLLPGASFFLNHPEDAPTRALIQAGVPVALATDCNPGTCMTENILLMLTLGMSRLKMSPEEVLLAVTRHAAQAIARTDVAGQLSPGRPADITIFNVRNHRQLPYHFGVDHTESVYKNGRRVFSRSSPGKTP